MTSFDLRSWRTVTTAKLFDLMAAVVMAGMVFISATRLTILPGDVHVLGPLDGSGNAVRQLLFLSGFGIMLVVSRPFHDPWRLVTLPISLWLLIGWCIASVTWSAVPDVAMRRLFLTILVIWMAFRTVDRLGHRGAMDVTLYTCIALLFANLIAVALIPDAVHHNQGALKDPTIMGAWRGILPEKNSAGILSAVTFLLLAFGVGRLWMPLRLALIALSIIFLLGTHSKTAMGLVGIAAVCGGLFMLYNPMYRILIIPPLTGCVVVLIYCIMVYLPPYMDQLGSSLDAFTGRIQIWRIMVAYINDHPWLGAGFQSVWNVGPASPIYHYSSVKWINSAIAEGHNGYLDQWMQAGLPGLILAVFAIFILPIARLVVSHRTPRREGGLHFAILLFVFGHNFMESSILNTDQFGELMLMLTIAGIGNMLRDPGPSGVQERKPVFQRWMHPIRQARQAAPR